ncbi:MAG: GntR family transcriptional regulator [Myxococcota bacterium]|nr:GntR family transcriptional regulator [Myxococcota bacterium]
MTINSQTTSDLTPTSKKDNGSLNNGKSPRASDRVANRLRKDILSRQLPVGCRLLPERKLAEVLGVSRVTVRSAIATLQSEQLLEVKRGSGITVLDYRESASVDLFSWLIASDTLPAEEQFEVFCQVVRVRQTLAIPTLFEAITKASPEDRKSIESLIKQQEKNLDDGARYIDLDLEIGQHIARIADNLVVELLHNSLRRAMASREKLILAFLGPLEAHCRYYQFILQAFELGVQLASNKAMREQLVETIQFFEAEGLKRAKTFFDSTGPSLDPGPTEGPGLVHPRG